jgi:hypothetical protein
MNRELLSVIARLPMFLVVACLATSLAAAEPKPAPPLSLLIAKEIKGADPAEVRRLMLWLFDIHDDDLVHLERMKRLEYLDLRQTKISSAGLVHLRPLSNLTHLYLSNNRRVDDAGLAHLEPLTRLVDLGLAHTKVTDAGLKHLKPLTQ